MSRLFTALRLPPDVRDILIGLPDDLPGARFVEFDDLHLTLRFFGEVDRHTAGELVGGLALISGPSIMLSIEGLDAFGGDRPRSLIATVAASAALEELQRKHEKAARSAGLEPERRKYTPHVTVARLNGSRPQAVADYIARIGRLSIAPFMVGAFDLLSSRPGTGGPPYRVEETFWFSPEADDDVADTADWQEG